MTFAGMDDEDAGAPRCGQDGRARRTEALAGRRLSHPNVPGVIDFGVTAEGTPFLVMEHVAGERLSCIVEREGALDAFRASVLVRQILAALDAAHAAGVVHADVKSDNVLVSGARDGDATPGPVEVLPPPLLLLLLLPHAAMAAHATSRQASPSAFLMRPPSR